MTTASGKQKVAAALAAVYGLTSIAGGTYGYVAAGSIPSIIAGGIAGVLLILCAAGTIYYRPLWCLLGAAIISIALLGRFLPSVVKGFSESTAPLDLKAWTALVMTIGGLIVLFSSAFALGLKRG
jgi:uncharacterized membrane protein (UPF0136 family)